MGVEWLMNLASLVGRFLIWSAIAGELGAVAMVLVLWAFTRSGLAKTRLIIAIGSLVTRSYERAAWMGGMIHVVAGLFFGQIYTLVLLAIGHPGVGPNMMWGAVLGMFHGLIMSLLLIAAVADAHPLEEFQQRSFAIALSHWVGHVAYGLVVGAAIGASGLIMAQ
jgi:hypothetical protein